MKNISENVETVFYESSRHMAFRVCFWRIWIFGYISSVIIAEKKTLNFVACFHISLECWDGYEISPEFWCQKIKELSSIKHMFFHQIGFYFVLFNLAEIVNLNSSKLLPIIWKIHLSLSINACFVLIKYGPEKRCISTLFAQWCYK